MPLDFSQFTAPCKKTKQPSPRKIIVPISTPDMAAKQQALIEQGLIKTSQTSPTHSEDGRKYTRREPWTPPGENVYDEADAETGIEPQEWASIQKDMKPARKGRKSKTKPKIVTAQPRKRRRAPAQKITVQCGTCSNICMEYPSNIPPKGDVGSGYRCERCLSG